LCSINYVFFIAIFFRIVKSFVKERKAIKVFVTQMVGPDPDTSMVNHEFYTCIHSPILDVQHLKDNVGKASF